MLSTGRLLTFQFKSAITLVSSIRTESLYGNFFLFIHYSLHFPYSSTFATNRNIRLTICDSFLLIPSNAQVRIYYYDSSFCPFHQLIFRLKCFIYSYKCLCQHIHSIQEIPLRYLHLHLPVI